MLMELVYWLPNLQQINVPLPRVRNYSLGYEYGLTDRETVQMVYNLPNVTKLHLCNELVM